VLSKEYTLEFVNRLERYVNGRVHTNRPENFWSLLKRGLSGTYVAVEPHVHRYLDEQMFRYNNRGTREEPKNDSHSSVKRQNRGRRKLDDPAQRNRPSPRSPH
jgi:hypothetical protein